MHVSFVVLSAGDKVWPTSSDFGKKECSCIESRHELNTRSSDGRDRHVITGHE